VRIDWLEIENFKNLRKFRIDFDESQLTTVLIGQNGTGKSNLFEALVLIFRALDLNEEPPFGFRMRYLCRGHAVEVWTEETKTSKLTFRFKVGDTEYAKARFMDERSEFLPQHVFAYYSGPSQRLAGTFEKHLEKFYRASTEGQTDELRRLFLCRGVHSQFVMLAFYAFNDETSRKVLREHLQVTGLDSVLFVLKKPHWYKKARRSRPAKGAKAGDARFFGARGMVQEFLDHLWDSSLAPLYFEESVRDDYRTQATKEERLFLFVKDQKALSDLAKKFGEPKTFFANLETTDLSDLIREVRIRVKREGVDDFLTFKELSEGEQQLLAVLGLLKFTKQDESLFLLDEPDTHLNPVWKRNYINLLREVVNLGQESHLLMATHDPLVVGGLTREEVRVLVRDDKGHVSTLVPSEDPKGMGFAGLLKSELFGLRSTLDPETAAALDRRYALAAKKTDLTAPEQEELKRLTGELEKLGFSQEFRDPYFEQFVKAMAAQPQFQKPTLTPEERERVVGMSKTLVEKMLNKEKL
jgi:predicted ATPase